MPSFHFFPCHELKKTHKCATKQIWRDQTGNEVLKCNLLQPLPSPPPFLLSSAHKAIDLGDSPHFGVCLVFHCSPVCVHCAGQRSPPWGHCALKVSRKFQLEDRRAVPRVSGVETTRAASLSSGFIDAPTAKPAQEHCKNIFTSIHAGQLQFSVVEVFFNKAPKSS